VSVPGCRALIRASPDVVLKIYLIEEKSKRVTSCPLLTQLFVIEPVRRSEVSLRVLVVHRLYAKNC
jgi:hypothetical protein